ncbi:TonB-linked outer membrane protein, SusC/RagA family [bacterium A37T11]|nr:TonB-linked outer membrane protein, SusC/RagA family [bacterium A37T11]
MIMKMTIIFFTIGLLHVSAAGLAQNITLEGNNISLKDVFSEISKQTGYHFMWSADKIQNNLKLDVSLKNVPLEDALTKVFNGLSLKYTIKDKNILVKRIDENDIWTHKDHFEGPDPKQRNGEFIFHSLPQKIVLDIKGKIINEKNEPLAGVSILIKGTNKGSTTNSNGNFSIAVKEGDILIISFLGYLREEITVHGKSDLVIRLKEGTSELDQVVVVGYGTQRKATLTGAISTISAEQLANRPTAQVLNSLQGIVPGMVITRSDAGRPGGESMSATIRGVTSRTGASILVVIDGIPSMLGIGELSNISPDEIQSITILKDAQAAIYGSQAAAGVMLITTKNGKSLKPLIEVNSNLTINTPGIKRKQVNILQAIDVLNQAFANDGNINNYWSPFVKYINTTDLSKTTTITPGPFSDTHDLTLSNNDWMDIIWGKAIQKNVNVAVSGKTEKSNYYLSMGYLDQPSMMQYGKDGLKKYTFRGKYGFEITKYLAVSTNIGLSTNTRTEPTNYGTIENLAATNMSGMATYTPDGSYYGWGGYLSAIGYAEKGGQLTDHITEGNLQFQGILKPLKNLEITAQYNTNQYIGDDSNNRLGFMNYYMDGTKDFNSIVMYGGYESVNAYYLRSQQNTTNLYSTYKYNIGAHNFSILGGFSNTTFSTRNINDSRRGDPYLSSSNLIYLGAGSADFQFTNESKSSTGLVSTFGRLSYDYQEKYIFEGNYRTDISSSFAPGHRAASFFGGSVGWVFTKENFFSRTENSSYLNSGKLRLSWGQLGNQTGIGAYDYVQLIAAGGSYPIGDPLDPTYAVEYYIPSLKSATRSWEKIETKNIGIDLIGLNQRLSGSFDYFIKTNPNMFYSYEFPSTLGINPPSINGAKIQTKGWEVSLNWHDHIIKDLKYNVGFVLSDNKSKVLSLADSRTPGYGLNNWVEGYSTGSYFTYQYDGLINSASDLANYKSTITSGLPSNLRTGDAKYKDINGDGKLTSVLYNPKDPASGGDMVYLGNNNIRNSYSFNIGFDYKGFSINALFQGVGKKMVMDNTTDKYAYYRNPLQYYYNKTWTDERTDALYPKLTQDGTTISYNYTMSDAPYMYVNAGYLRLKNLQISYNFQPYMLKKLHMQGLQIYFSGTDLAEWSKIPKGFEVEKPFVVSSTPFPRSYTMGLNFTL